MNQQNKIVEYLEAKCRQLFPKKKQLFNPYDVRVNNELYLLDGFGVGFGALAEDNQVTGCLRLNQNFIIPLTRKFYSLENDSDERQAYEQELMAEAMTLIKNIAKDVTLGGNASRTIFAGSPGIQQVFGESQQYIFLTLTFNASFKENL